MGEWKGRRIVSESWVRQATERHVDLAGMSLGVGYGFQWWHGSYEVGGREVQTVLASGNGGNHIQVVPTLDLVVVLLSTAYAKPYMNSRSFDVFRKVLATVKT